MWIGILVGALSCYALKIAGLSVPKQMLEDPRIQKIAALLPVALLAALIVTQTFSEGHRLTIDVRVIGVACALVAVLFRAPFLLVVALAAVSTALVRLIV